MASYFPGSTPTMLSDKYPTVCLKMKAGVSAVGELLLGSICLALETTLLCSQGGATWRQVSLDLFCSQDLTHGDTDSSRAFSGQHNSTSQRTSC